MGCLLGETISNTTKKYTRIFFISNFTCRSRGLDLAGDLGFVNVFAIIIISESVKSDFH